MAHFNFGIFARDIIIITIFTCFFPQISSSIANFNRNLIMFFKSYKNRQEPRELWSAHFPVVLEKSGGHFGFSIDDFRVGTTEGIFVHQSSASGFYNCVPLARGDKIESVNGVDIGRMTASDAANHIQKAKGPAVFMVRRLGRNEVPWTQEMQQRVNWANSQTHPSAPPVTPPMGRRDSGPPYHV